MKKFSDCFWFEPKFFILRKTDNRVIAVEIEDASGYKGLLIDFDFKTNTFEVSPCFIAKTFISKLLEKYDFTINMVDAELHCVSQF